MEPAKIDWKAINSVFVEDELFEHINAPQWIDLSAPQDSIDDESWFCRPDCNHPKTVEDFLKETSNSKIRGSARVSEILPLGDWSRRDGTLKRRGLVQPLVSSDKDSNCDRLVENSENQNPNFSTPSKQYNSMKAAIKSSTEKKQIDNSLQKEDTPLLKSTLSARNLFAGRDILNQITDFCNELKRLATRAKERENVERSNTKKSPVVECPDDDDRGDSDEREKERKPLLEVRKEKCDTTEKSHVKAKLNRKKRTDQEAENIPISVDLKNVKRKEEEILSQIRTLPPSPQCFSAGRGPTKATPLKASRSRPPLERGILQELGQSNKEVRNDEPAADKGNHRGTRASNAAEREARTLDVFWFLKPCTISN
ncbi:uncharacterized protein LOC132299325 [Cornus florida]|uniref:uncharacterized protein LOC132299325 n=1 Tax=Cornus florida TaxID=4283 RepID=UPI0028A00200|nr:uncharacterized protein LOC132299325 [Cornus florida]